MNNDLNDIINSELLNKSPFTVPENYFSTLGERIMENIPETEKQHKEKARTFTLKTWRWAAAVCVFVVAFSTVYTITIQKHNIDNSLAETDKLINTADDDIIQAADYTMLDNHEFYQLLAED